MLSPAEEDEIKEIFFSLEKFGLGDIKKSLNQDMLIATFILCVCFVDALVQYRFYQEKYIRGDSAKNWNSFIDGYFPEEYRGMGSDLCEKLRNKIVHNYSGNRFYALGDDSDKINHLETLVDGRIFLNVNNFVSAVNSAFYKYKKELFNSESLKGLALCHSAKYPIFKYQIVESMFAGFLEDWNIMSYWVNVTSIPGGVTANKPHDRYIVRFRDRPSWYEEPGPLMLVISKSVNRHGIYKYRFEGNSPKKGLNWDDFIAIIAEQIDKRRAKIESGNSEQNSAQP